MMRNKILPLTLIMLLSASLPATAQPSVQADITEVTAAQRMVQIMDEILAAQAANDTARMEALRKEMTELAPRVQAEQKAAMNKVREQAPTNLAEDMQKRARQIEAQAETPEWKISFAARKGNLAEVKRLRAAGAELNFYRLDPAPPLMEAAMHGQVEVARFLLAEGAQQRLQKSLITLDALRLAAEASEDNSPMLRLLVKEGALQAGDIENLGSATLKDAEKKGERHAQMQAKQLTSGSALMAAIEKNRPRHVQTLLEIGANANDWAYGKSALMLAASKLNVEVVEILLNKGADANAIGPQKKTALQFAQEIKENANNSARRSAIIERLTLATTG